MEKEYLSDTVHGERIKLKQHKVELAQKMFDYVVEDKDRLLEFLPWPKHIQTINDEINFINRCIKQFDNYESVHYGIYRNSDDEYMGNISAFKFDWDDFHCEIGYWILGKFEGRGYMSEAVKLLEEALFAIGFNRLVIRCNPKNERSYSIPKRLNYQLEGTQRQIMVLKDGFADLDVYSKLKTD